MSIHIHQIQKKIGGSVIIDNITLDFPSGSLVALLGPSGCGKTTLLRIIAGLETADSGNVFLHGEDTSDIHVRERKVGFVFQHYALFRHMTIFDNIAFGLRVKPRKQRPTAADIHNRVHQLLELVQLENLVDRYPAQLSGGQRQRIALARALAVEPRVLLLDEPFGALDAKVRKELRRWLRRLHDELHITSIFVTHDQEEALEVSDHIVLLNKGRVEQVGTPDYIYQHPATPFVYSFLGGLNLFHGRVQGNNLKVEETIIPLHKKEFDCGSEVIGFVKPSELTIELDITTSAGIKARISRILVLGSMGRIELCNESDQYYEAELPTTKIASLQLKEGQYVRIIPSKLHVL